MFYMKTWQQAALTVAYLFTLGSLIGWVIELLYRRFISKNNPDRKWINPGFLRGPYLPLYGTGLTVVFAMSYIPDLAVKRIGELTAGKILLIIVAMGLAMTLVEYIGGLIFILRLNIKLWDYSDEWGNVQGIVCPKFTFYWTVMSGIYYIFVQPRVVRLVTWYYDNIAFTFIIGMFFGIFVIDLCYSLHVGIAIKNFAKEKNIIVRYEVLKGAIERSKDELQDRARFTLAFVSSIPLREHLANYADTIKSVPGNIREMPRSIEGIAKMAVEKIRGGKSKDPVSEDTKKKTTESENTQPKSI